MAGTVVASLFPAAAVWSEPPPDPIVMSVASLTAGGGGVAIRWTIRSGWLPKGGFNLYRIEPGGDRIRLNRDGPLGASTKRGNAKAASHWNEPKSHDATPLTYTAALAAADNSQASVDEKQVGPLFASRHTPPPTERTLFDAIGQQVHQLRHTPGPSVPSSVAETHLGRDPLVASYSDKLLPAPSPKKPTLLVPPNPGTGKTTLKSFNSVHELQAIRQNLLAGALSERDIADDLGLAFDDSSAEANRTYQYELRSVDAAGKESREAVATATIARVGMDAAVVPAELMAHQLDAEHVALRWHRPSPEEMTSIGMATYDLFRSSGSEAPIKVNRKPIVVADVKGKDGIVEPINFFKDQKVPVGTCSYKLVQTDMFGRKTESAPLSFTMEDWFMPAAPTMAQAELKNDDVTVTWRTSIPESGTPDGNVQYRIYREDIEQEAEKSVYNKVDRNNSPSSKVVAIPDAISKSTNHELFTPKGGGLFRSPVGADWQLLTATSVKGEMFSLDLARTFPGGRLARTLEKSAVKKSSRSDDWLHYVDHNVPKDHKYRYFVTAAYPKNEMETTATGTTPVMVPLTTALPSPANLKHTVQKLPPAKGPTMLKPVSGGYVITGKNGNHPITLPPTVTSVHEQDTGATVTLTWDPVGGTPPVTYRVYRASASEFAAETKGNGDKANANTKGPPSKTVNLNSPGPDLSAFAAMIPRPVVIPLGDQNVRYQDLTVIPKGSFTFLGQVRDTTTYEDDIPRSQAHKYVYAVVAVNRWGVPAGGPKEGTVGSELPVRVPATMPPSAPAVISVAANTTGQIEILVRPNPVEENVKVYKVKRKRVDFASKDSPQITGSVKTGAGRFGIHRPEPAIQALMRSNPNFPKQLVEDATNSKPNYEDIGEAATNPKGDGTFLFEDQKAVAHEVYSYYVVAENTDGLEARSGNHPGSTEISAEYGGPKPNPTATCQSVKLTWAPIQDARGYVVERGPQAKPGSYVQLTGIRPETAYTDYSVQPGETYRYRVIAVTAAGNVSSNPAETPVTVPAK